MKTKRIFLSYDEKTFKKLSNLKEEAKINGDVKSWEEWIIKLAKLQ